MYRSKLNIYFGFPIGLCTRRYTASHIPQKGKYINIYIYVSIPIQGFPDPGGFEFEDDRNLLPRFRVLSIDVRHEWLVRGVHSAKVILLIGVIHGYYGEEVCFLETAR